MTTIPVRVGDQTYWLDDATAASLIRRLGATDAQAADGQAVFVPMLLMDSASAPAQAQARKENTAVTTPLTKIRIGDADVFVDARAADEIARLQGTVAALNAMRAGAPAAQIAGAAKEARLADEARRRDPTTPYGQYCDRLANAWKTGGAAA